MECFPLFLLTSQAHFWLLFLAFLCLGNYFSSNSGCPSTWSSNIDIRECIGKQVSFFLLIFSCLARDRKKFFKVASWISAGAANVDTRKVFNLKSAHRLAKQIFAEWKDSETSDRLCARCFLGHVVRWWWRWRSKELEMVSWSSWKFAY